MFAQFMKKKILISTLTLLFLVATTGLSTTISFCKLAGAQDKDNCTMHHKLVSSGCCADETSESPRIVSFENPGCCEIEFVYNKIKDDFVFNKPNVNIFTSSENFLQPVTLTTIPTDFSSDELFYCDSSPPFLINPELHITNSVLLI
jgi:hypothetical protein